MTNKIFIGIDGKKQEAKGKVLENLLQAQAEAQEQIRLLEAEQQAKQTTLDSAVAKLAKLGLTEDEAKAIIGIQ